MNKVKDAQIIDYYRTAMNNKEKPTLQNMAEQFGVTSEYMSKLLDSCGLRTRSKRERSARQFPKCPECGTKADHYKPCYCWKCGADMRPTIDKAIEAMQELCTCAPFTGKLSVCVGDLCKYLEQLESEIKK